MYHRPGVVPDGDTERIWGTGKRQLALPLIRPRLRSATFPQGKAFGMVLRLRAYRPSSGHFVATFPQGKASLRRTQFDANLLLP